MSILEDALPSQRVYPGEPGYLKGRGHLHLSTTYCCCCTSDGHDGDDDSCCLLMSACCWWAYLCGREDAVWIRYDVQSTAELQAMQLELTGPERADSDD